MTNRKSPKKSETLEIRLPHTTKSAFMARCRGEGRTASDALRSFIEREIDGGALRSRRAKLRGWQAVVAALAGLAVGAIAAPTLAHPVSNTRVIFDHLDRNHDGVLSFEEFRRG